MVSYSGSLKLRQFAFVRFRVRRIICFPMTITGHNRTGQDYNNAYPVFPGCLMHQRSHRRRIVLFLVAIVVPSLVLVVLSLRMISQERELTKKRLLDERHRRVNEIRQELLTHLESIKLKQVRALATHANGISTADYADSELVLVALVENNQLVLPWETNPAADDSQQLLAEPAFAQRIQKGEQEELAAKQFGKAAALYRETMRLARRPAQAAILWLFAPQSKRHSRCRSCRLRVLAQQAQLPQWQLRRC